MSMTRGPNSKPFGSSSSPENNQNLVSQLPAIDETRPNVEVETKENLEEDNTDEDTICSPGSEASAGACRKKCMKDRLRGLKDKYVSCLQAIDGAGDLRGCAASGGGPALAPATEAQPFESAFASAASLSAAPIAR